MPSYTISTITETPSMSATGGRHLAIESEGRLWASYSKTISNRLQVYCAYSDNDGITWTEAQVTTADEEHFYPVIAIDSNDDLHIAYTARSALSSYPTKRSLLYNKRTSGSWGSEELVAEQNVINPGQSQPSLAVDSADNVHVVWEGTGWGANPAQYSVQYRKRASGSWNSIEEIANETTDQRSPSLAIDASDNIHVVWAGKGWGANTTIFNIQYRKRTTSWQAQEAVTDVNNGQGDISIALDSSDNVHIVWAGTDAFYRKRTTSWQSQENITNDVTVLPNYLSIGIGAKVDVVRVVYSAGNTGNVYIRIRTSVWGNAVLIYKGGGGKENTSCTILWARHPTISDIITNATNRAYIIWEDEASKVLHGGLTILPSQDLTRVTGIRHTYFKGTYNLMAVLGGISAFTNYQRRDKPIPWSPAFDYGGIFDPFAFDPTYINPEDNPDLPS